MTPDSARRMTTVLAEVALAAGLALVLLTASVSAVRASDLGDVWRVAVLTSLVALHVSVLGRRRWPVATFAVASAAMLLLAFAPDLSGEAAQVVNAPYSALLLPSGLIFFVALYTVSSRTAAPTPHVALAVALLGGVITVGRLWNADEYATTAEMGVAAWRPFITAAVAAGVTAAWSLGRYRATRIAWVAALEERALQSERERLAAIEQAQRDLAREAERAGLAERRRIAREMHDVVAHSLAVVVGQAEGGRMLIANDPERAPEVLSTIAGHGRQALSEMRSLLGVLREDDVPTRLPQPGLDDLDRVIEEVRRAGTSVELRETGRRGGLSGTAELASFRVVQEALTNVVKHAHPGASATVMLDWGPQDLRIRVWDDGRYIDRTGPEERLEARPQRHHGRGLLGMSERLALVGGHLAHVGPNPSGAGGFLVEARIPLSTTDRPEEVTGP